MSALIRQVAYNVINAPLRPFPYPHIYVPDVFPEDFYARLQEAIPDPEAMIPIEQARPVKGYKERFVLDVSGPLDGLPDDKRSFWSGLAKDLRAGAFRDALLNKFGAQLRQRFEGQADVRFYDETLLVQDITRYSLGPHTDTPIKAVTVLFYLPRDRSQIHLGTSIYMPKDPNGRCPGGPHYGYEGFDRVATMPFAPNSMFAFVKSDRSFHGVEPVVDPDVRRWLLLYDIKVKLATAAAAAPAKAEAAPQTP